MYIWQRVAAKHSFPRSIPVYCILKLECKNILCVWTDPELVCVFRCSLGILHGWKRRRKRSLSLPWSLKAVCNLLPFPSSWRTPCGVDGADNSSDRSVTDPVSSRYCMWRNGESSQVLHRVPSYTKLTATSSLLSLLCVQFTV